MYPVCYNAMVLHEPYSGVEVTVHQLACALVTCGTLPLSLCIPPNQRTIPVAPHVTVHVSKLATQSRLLRILWEQTLLPLHLKRIRSPLLHAPAYVAPLLCPCPFILTIHDLHVLTHPQFCSRSNRLHYRLLIPPSIRKAAAIIAYSPYTRQTILNYFPEAEGRLVVIPPGIAPTFSRCTDYARLRSVRQRYALPLSFLLFVGDLSQRKNIVNLIRAFAIVQAERPDMHLILAGAADPKAGADLDRVIREHGVPHRVSRIGYVHADDLPVFYSLAEAFVFPSHDEGFGLPPLEAMAGAQWFAQEERQLKIVVILRSPAIHKTAPLSPVRSVSCLTIHNFALKRLQLATEKPPSSHGKMRHMKQKRFTEKFSSCQQPRAKRLIFVASLATTNTRAAPAPYSRD